MSIRPSKYIFRYPFKAPKFILFESRIKSSNWELQKDILVWAEKMFSKYNSLNYRNNFSDNRDILYKEFSILYKNLEKTFYKKYSHLTEVRILIHLPSINHSAGGFSLFNNIIQAISYLGLKVEALEWDNPIESKLSSFRPTIFITSDHSSYLSRINWREVQKYRIKNVLRIGLTASLQEYGNTHLIPRLLWAKKNKIDFYYSFRASEYIQSRSEYLPFFDQDYKIISVEFGANPFLYHPIPGIKKDLNFVFLASANPEKWERYYQYLTTIFHDYGGLIDGPNWTRIRKWLPPHLHKFVYARAKVGMNLHIPVSIDYPSELNERTYILAACGVPQLIDDAKLLNKRFNINNMFVAENPKQYVELFKYILHNPEIAEKKAIGALKEVFEKHTTFHRANNFVYELIKMFN